MKVSSLFDFLIKNLFDHGGKVYHYSPMQNATEKKGFSMTFIQKRKK